MDYIRLEWITLGWNGLHQVGMDCVRQSSTTCGAIDDRRISLKAIDEHVFTKFCDKNAVFTHFCDKNAVFTNFCDKTPKKRVNRDKTDFATKLRMFGPLIIDEGPSLGRQAHPSLHGVNMKSRKFCECILLAPQVLLE